MHRSIAKAPILALQLLRQGQQPVTAATGCLTQLSDLQQIAAAALRAGNSSSAWGLPWQTCGSVRCMGGRTHKLSLKKANNKASWLAAAPFLDKQQDGQQQQQLPPPIQTALPPLPVLEEPVLHQHIGRITGPYSVRPQPCFAVIESGGCQWKVTADDVIYHNKIPQVQVNDVLQFNKVLLLGTQEETTIGRPFVPGATVVAAVEETFKDAKVHVFKKKKRKRYSKLYGHRSHITALRILEVRQPAAGAPAAEAAEDVVPQLTNVAPICADSSVDLSAPAPAAGATSRSRMPSGRRQQGAATAAAAQQESPATDLQEPAAATQQAAAAAASAQHHRPDHQPAGSSRLHGPPAVLAATDAMRARSQVQPSS